MTITDANNLWRKDPTHFSHDTDDYGTAIFWREIPTANEPKIIAWFDGEGKPIYYPEIDDNRRECLGWMRSLLDLGELNYPRVENESALIDKYIANLEVTV
jgi:hypothetical protein